MKRIRIKNIDHSKLITKSQYAKNNKLSPMKVHRMVENGELTIVNVEGGEIIHL
jgi:hypothetical protein